MLPLIERLLVLQDRDRRRLRLETELAEIPRQRQRLQERAAQNAAAADGLKQRTRHLESERKRLELEVHSKEEFIRKIETQQGATKSNEEYRRFTHQIETTRGEITALEDQELELMEQTEAAAKELASATQVATNDKATLDKLLIDLEAREANLTAELAEVRAERQRLAAGIEPGTLSKYDRLIEKRGDNIVVGVTGAICGGCHMKLTQQDFLRAKAQQDLVFCPNCTRILYYTRDMEP